MKSKTDTIEYFLRRILDQLYEIRVEIGKYHEQKPDNVVTWGDATTKNKAPNGYEIVNTWKPIETAPRDNSLIMVYCPGMIQRTYLARFDIRGIYSSDSFSGQITELFASHWMPLPEPPDSEVNPEKGLRL